MKLRMSIAKVVAVAAAAVVMGGAATSAQAEPSAPDDGFGELRAFYEEHGVPVSTQDQVIEKFQETGRVDSMAGGPPASTSSRIDGDYLITTSTYADGSISVIEAQQPSTEEGASTRATNGSVTGCSVTSGSGWANYSNCLVAAGTGFANISYRVTYEKYSGANAKLISSGSAAVSSNYGTMTAPTRDLWRPLSTSGINAAVKYHSWFKGTNNASSEDIYLGFYPSSTGVWTLTAS